jgi:hypothetical protein
MDNETISQVNAELNPQEELFEITEEPTKEPSIEEIPTYYSVEWHDYVMKQFHDDELIDGHPSCDGLRRIVELVIGPIIERQITHIIPINNLSDNVTGAVAVKIVIQPRNFQQFERTQLTEESIADINKLNTPDAKFWIHPMATCETRCEARVLRKLLRLRKVIAIEELAETNNEKLKEMIEWEPESFASEEQVNAIDLLCKRLDINVVEFINCGKEKYKTIFDIKRGKAAEIIQYLNKIQRSVCDKPKGVSSYSVGWKQ